jgi:DDE_Tnp_1-associated/Transposase DDE domain
MAATSLLDAFSLVPDPRDRRGRRHPLSAVLGLAAVALMAGCRSLEAIAQFGRDRGPRFAHALGFTRGKTPAKSLLSKLFRRLDVGKFEAALAAWAAARVPAEADVCIDGKVLTGSAGGGAPGVHLVAAYAPQARAVLGQVRVGASTNEHKAALALLGVLPVEGKVVTADAMSTHRDFAQAVLDGGGDYVLPLKGNQRALLADVEAAFDDASLSPLRA